MNQFDTAEADVARGIVETLELHLRDNVDSTGQPLDDDHRVAIQRLIAEFERRIARLQADE